MSANADWLVGAPLNERDTSIRSVRFENTADVQIVHTDLEAFVAPWSYSPPAHAPRCNEYEVDISRSADAGSSLDLQTAGALVLTEQR